MNTLTHHASLRSTRLPARAGSLRQAVGQRVQSWLTGLWSALEEAGHRRAAPHLLSQARRIEADNPALAAALRALAQPNDKPFVPAATVAGTR